MTTFYEEFERDRLAVCGPIRAEVGFDPDDWDRGDAGEVNSDQMWEYIYALECAVTAERRVRRMVGPNSEHLVRDCKRTLETG